MEFKGPEGLAGHNNMLQLIQLRWVAIMGQAIVIGIAHFGFGVQLPLPYMLEFCAKHNIVSEIELIKMEDINHAYDRMLKSDVKYRFVIDMSSLSL